MDSNTDQTNPVSDNGQAIDVKKLDDSPAPTQIVINSEDGSIMNANDVESTKPQDEPASNPEITQTTPTVLEETPQQIEVTETDSMPSQEPVTTETVSTEEAVQPLEEPAVTEEAAPAAEEVPVEPASVESQSEANTSQSTEDQTTQTVQEKLPESGYEPIEEATPTQANNPMAIPPQPQKKAGAPKAAVIVAIIIGLALMGVVVFAFMKSQKNDTTNDEGLTDQSQVENTQPVVQPFTSDEIDAATKEIDAEINKTTGDSDIPTSDSVNDQTLGL